LDKAPDAFRTISEVAGDLDVPQHVLRFWESRFPQIRPMKRGGGRRYYRPDDVDLLRSIRHLLYGEGYTIRGVQRILRENGPRFVQSVWQEGAPQPRRSTEDGTGRGLLGLLPAARESGRTEAENAPVEPTLDAPTHDLAGGLAQPGRLAAAVAARRPAGMAREDLQRLRQTVDELLACRQELDAALNDNA
jgi:DNA-binding transcriptional MerR regulator